MQKKNDTEILMSHYDIANCYSNKNKSIKQCSKDLISQHKTIMKKTIKQNLYECFFDVGVIKNIIIKNIDLIDEIELNMHGQNVEILYKDVIPFMQSLYDVSQNTIPFYLSSHNGIINQQNDVRLSILFNEQIEYPIIEYEIYSCVKYLQSIDIPFFQIIKNSFSVSEKNFMISAKLTGMYILMKNYDACNYITLEMHTPITSWLYDNHNNYNDNFPITLKKINKTNFNNIAVFKLHEKEDLYENIPFSNIDKIILKNPHVKNEINDNIEIYIIIANIMQIIPSEFHDEYLSKIKYHN